MKRTRVVEITKVSVYLVPDLLIIELVATNADSLFTKVLVSFVVLEMKTIDGPFRFSNSSLEGNETAKNLGAIARVIVWGQRRTCRFKIEAHDRPFTALRAVHKTDVTLAN